MKVLFLINYAGSGGSERYVELLAKRFHGSRCVCGLCYNERGALVDKCEALGMAAHRLVMRSPLDLSAAKALAALCKKEGYDVIHAQYPRENDIALLAKFFGCRAKVVLTSHLIMEQPGLWKLLNRLFTPRNHRVITVCSEGAQVLRRNGVAKDKIQVVFNGVDAAAAPARDRRVLAEFGIGEQELVITMLTRFSEEKGVDFLCDIIRQLQEMTDVPFRVLVPGTGPLLDFIRSYAKELGIADIVIMPGFRTDTAQLLAASDLYLNTSSSEAMSFAVLEALAAGLPLVVTDVGGNPELANAGGVCGFVVPYGDEAAFAGAVKTLLEDAGLRRRYGETARRKAEREFNLNALADQVFEIYQE